MMTQVCAGAASSPDFQEHVVHGHHQSGARTPFLGKSSRVALYMPSYRLLHQRPHCQLESIITCVQFS